MSICSSQIAPSAPSLAVPGESPRIPLHPA
jgi:hypothetical protein